MPPLRRPDPPQHTHPPGYPGGAVQGGEGVSVLGGALEALARAKETYPHDRHVQARGALNRDSDA